jgi:hypothetical protein
MADKRDVKYLNRDFDSFKSELVEFSKTYFPTTYTDFTPASTGMLFMEIDHYPPPHPISLKKQEKQYLLQSTQLHLHLVHPNVSKR